MTVKLRQFYLADNERVGKVFAHALGDFLVRGGNEPLVNPDNAQDWRQFWEKRHRIFKHLSTTGEGWLAEIDNLIVGYVRATIRGPFRQLSEFFVLPQAQSAGVGRCLLDQVFSAQENNRRLVVATTDGSAVACYTRAGVYVQSVIFDIVKTPLRQQVNTDLTFERLNPSNQTLAVLNTIDSRVLGHTREVDHRWLIHDRVGFVCRRNDEALGYGYVGEQCGPFALLTPDDFPVVLRHTENLAANMGVDTLRLMVPMVNHVVMDYLTVSGFEMDYRFPMLCMTDDPRVQLDRYIMALPGFFI